MPDDTTGAVASQPTGGATTQTESAGITGGTDTGIDSAAEAAQAAEQDTAEREAFQRSRGKDPKPKVESKPKPAPKATEPEGDDEADEPEDAAGDAPQIDRDALTRALGVLRRDNVPQRIIEQLLDDPAELLAWAEKAGKRQADIDQRLKPGSAPDPKAGETGEADGAEPTGSPDTDEALAQLVAPFAEEMGSEHAAQTLTNLAAHVQRATLAQIQPLLDKLQRGFDYLGEQHELQGVRAAREALRERFPQVADDSTWATIMERAKVLSKTGGYNDFESVLRDAAAIEDGGFNMREAQQRMYDRQHRRTKSQPTAPSRTPSKPAATPEEQEFAEFRRIKRGG